MSGSKIIDGLKEAVAEELARVTIDGQTWVRAEAAEAERDRIRAETIEECAKVAEEYGREHRRYAVFDTANKIATAIRALPHSREAASTSDDQGAHAASLPVDASRGR